MHIIISPLSLPSSKKKNFSLNMNVYHTTHHRVWANMKILYKDTMYKQISALPEFNRVRLIYTLYPRDSRLCDLGNILPIHGKFFEDAFVSAGKLRDDNYKFIPEVNYRIGEIDKINPRVQIQIIELDPHNTLYEIDQQIDHFCTLNTADQKAILESKNIRPEPTKSSRISQFKSKLLLTRLQKES